MTLLSLLSCFLASQLPFFEKLYCAKYTINASIYWYLVGNSQLRYILKNVTRKANKNKRPQKSRAKHRCPEKLARLLEFVNMLPPDCELISLSEIEPDVPTFPVIQNLPEKMSDAKAVIAQHLDQASEEEAEGALRNMQAWITDKPSAFQEFIFPQNDELLLFIPPRFQFEMRIRWYRVKERYLEFALCRECLRNLARIINLSPNPNGFDLETIPDHDTDFIKQDFLESTWESLRGSLSLDEVLQPPKALIAGRLALDSQFRVHIHLNRLADSLNGEVVDRVRLCEICGRIFWAQRKDKWACEGKCSDARRKRLSRANQRNNEVIYKRSQIKRAEQRSTAKQKGR